MPDLAPWEWACAYLTFGLLLTMNAADAALRPKDPAQYLAELLTPGASLPQERKPYGWFGSTMFRLALAALWPAWLTCAIGRRLS